MNSSNIFEVRKDGVGIVKVPICPDQPEVSFAHLLTERGGLPCGDQSRVNNGKVWIIWRML